VLTHIDHKASTRYTLKTQWQFLKHSHDSSSGDTHDPSLDNVEGLHKPIPL